MPGLLTHGGSGSSSGGEGKHAAAGAATALGPPAGVVGVDWAQELPRLAAGEEWAQLVADLEAAPGGGTLVAVVLRRAMHAMAEQAQRGPGAAAEASEAAAAQLVAAAQGVAWEKLHSGSWHEVAVAWRDAYSLACLLAAAAALLRPAAPAAVAAAAGAGQQPLAAATAEGVRAALLELDMAALMGGPLFRPTLDRLISALQDAWQCLAPAAPPPLAAAAAATPATGVVAPAEAAAAEAVEEGERSSGGSGGLMLVEAGPVGLGAQGPVPLPPGSMGPRGTPVPVEELPSLESFWREYMHREGGSIPVLIEGGMENWPALGKWQDVQYLRTVAGPRTVPVEVGEHYLADQWGQKLMTLQDFIDRHILAPPSSAGACAAGAARVAQGQRGYLAQHPLFEQIPQLAADIREPDYCCLGEGELQSVNAWFGPAGTVTPLHMDPHHNLLCQVVGRKYVRFYRPEDTPAMYPFSEGLTTNSSQVDMDEPDPTRFPRFHSAHFSDCVLSAGQMLYIPPGWWHYVKALDTSFSVSFWWK